MNKKELISIAIPIFNVEAYLKECLDSVLNQTYQNIEVILINDGSTDNSLDIAKSYLNDTRVRLIDKGNEGTGAARNIGMEQASGAYFCTVDSDDYLSPLYIEKMYQKMKKWDADVCVCAREAFVEKKRESLLLSDRLPDCEILEKEYIEKKYAQLAREYQMSDSWNKMYRTAFIRKVGIKYTLNRKYNGGELLFNHLLLLHRPKLTHVNEILYYYRILQTSKVRRKNKKLYEGFVHIADCLYKQADQLGYKGAIFDQIAIIYTHCMKYAVDDVYSEAMSGGRNKPIDSAYNEKSLKSEFDKIIRLNGVFLMEHGRLKLKQKMPTISMRIFEFSLNQKTSWLLVFYCRTLAFLKGYRI
ncbi:glycosyltransferase [Lachnospiraceae bacterium ZAX-1]